MMNLLLELCFYDISNRHLKKRMYLTNKSNGRDCILYTEKYFVDYCRNGEYNVFYYAKYIY